MTADPANRNPPLRLLFVQTQAETAGAQEISRLLGRELARGGGFEEHHLFLYRKTAGCDGLPNVHFAAMERPSGPLAAVRFALRLFSLMRRIRPDAVLAFQHYGNIVAAPVARLAGVRLVIANHVSAPAAIGRLARGIDRLLGLAGFYDAITVNSRETWRDYQAYPDRYRRRILYVPHGFADRASTLGKSEARARFGLPADAPLIGTVARLHPLKRIDLAIAVLPRIEGLHLAVAGQGPDEQRLREAAQKAGVAGRVHFVGEIDGDGVAAFLAGLDLFAFPSAAETFGLAAAEAAQAGVPVVANDLPVLREVLEADGEACALFVDAADADAFAGAVRRVLDDPDLRARLSDTGRLLSKRYSLSAMTDAYRRLILDGLPAAGPAPEGDRQAAGLGSPGRRP